MIWAKAIAVFVLIAIAETLHGMLRMKYLNRPLGDRRARQLGVLTGSLLIVLISWFLVPWIGPRTVADTFLIGGLWLVLMLSFDIGLGRYVFHASWSRILREFDPRQGGFLALGMLVLFLAPFVVAKVLGLL